MTISIIIVSYNTKNLTLSCLRSLALVSTDPQSIEIIVVDNASADGTVQLIKQDFPQVKVIENHDNLGFARANNQGAGVATGEYLFFLNSDTELPKGSLSTLFELLQTRQPDIASCRLQNPDGSLQPQGGSLPNPINIPLWMLNLDNLPVIRQLVPPYQIRYREFFEKDRSMGWVGGTAMAVKRDVYIQLKGFDEHIFMYAEDVDLCWRAHQTAYSVVYYHQPVITHCSQGSSHPGRAILGEYHGLLYVVGKHIPGLLLYLRLWLKVGAYLRVIYFAMMGKHDQSTLYHQAAKLV